MEKLSANECYQALKADNFVVDSSWQGQMPGLLMSDAATMLVKSLKEEGDLALQCAHTAVAFASEKERPYALLTLSIVELRLGHIEEAKEAAMEAREIARTRDDDLLEADACDELVRIHEAEGSDFRSCDWSSILAAGHLPHSDPLPPQSGHHSPRSSASGAFP